MAQHGVFSLQQLRGVGFTAKAIYQRARRHRLHRIHHSVYSLVPRELLTPKGHWMAAVLACGPRAVLSHRSAAALHGLRQTRRRNIDVTVADRSARCHDGIDVHRATTLSRTDVTEVDGIPCTSVARTLFDLATVLPRRPVERAFDQADAEESLDMRAIDGVLERTPNHRGTRIVRSILEEHYIGSTPTWSELEEAFLAICRRLGVPDHRVNHWIELNDGGLPIRGDFVWIEKRVIVETDGAKYHGTHQARQRDPLRDQRAIIAGWQPIRTTWRQVMHRPRELEPTILRLVGGPPEPPPPPPAAPD